MTATRIRQDIERLAGALPHRGANTTQERAAAEYLLERFREYTPDVEMDDFYSPESPMFLFASYYAEFIVVAALNYWFPWVALVYGMGVFLAYITEFSGFPLLSRFLPQYETQNVVARFLGTNPKRLIIVSANYDTGKTTPLAAPGVLPWIRAGHLIVVLAMVLVVITCGLKAVSGGDTVVYSVMSLLRNGALGVLAAAGGLLIYADFNGEYVRGAANNAAGTAALLSLADRIHSNPIEDADVWLVATGAKESWMDGMRHFVTSHKFDRGTTYFLNIASAGAGKLRYTTAEGMLQLHRAAPEMIRAAESAGGQREMTAHVYRSFPTDAIVPLSRGYKTLGFMATDDSGGLAGWRTMDDTASRVDCAQTERLADTCEAVLRALAQD
ncbi:MAG: M28 family peptidase [Candidatus Hydrogenedentes bacterium]|nr:M28 family peptidase [Candidatus Hydrogenedentota bacterium]